MILAPAAFLAPLAVVLDTSFWGVFSDPKQLGLATLIAVGAILVGFIVRRMWPRSMNPPLFGWLAATAVVAALAYLGVPGAALVLWLFIGAAVLLGILALVFN